VIESGIGTVNAVEAADAKSESNPEPDTDGICTPVNSGESICSKYVLFGVYSSLYCDGAPPYSPNFTFGELGTFP